MSDLNRYSVKIVTPTILDVARFNEMMDKITAVVDEYARVRSIQFDSGAASVVERERWDETHG